jgi:acyl-CoA synthetase (NDP forming)
LKQFNKAQDNEMAALKHRHKSEMKELRAAHKAQLNEWESKERQARHQFFANNKGGPERRTYVQDYLRRREVLLKIQSDDEDRRSQEQSVRVDSLKNDQSQRLKEFQDFLNRGERPPARLWSNGA